MIILNDTTNICYIDGVPCDSSRGDKPLHELVTEEDIKRRWTYSEDNIWFD